MTGPVAQLQVWTHENGDGTQDYEWRIPRQPGHPSPERYPKRRTVAEREDLDLALLETATSLRTWRPGQHYPTAGEHSFPELGQRLVRRFLPSEIRAFVFGARTPLYIETTDPAFPWELLYANDTFLGAYRPVGRSSPLSQPFVHPDHHWQRERKALLIGDPWQDLPKSAEELHDLAARLQRYPTPYQPTRIEGHNASAGTLMRALQQGYEFLHFVGHTEFVEEHTGASYLSCANGGMLSAEDIRGRHGDYAFVFINGCQGARAAITNSPDPYLLSSGGPRVEGLAQAFLDGGALAFVSALWPIFDTSAHHFARAFYEQVFAGFSFAEALRRVRAAWLKQRPDDPTWAAYILYGHPVLNLETVRLGSQAASAAAVPAEAEPADARMAPAVVPVHLSGGDMPQDGQAIRAKPGHRRFGFFGGHNRGGHDDGNAQAPAPAPEARAGRAPGEDGHGGAHDTLDDSSHDRIRSNVNHTPPPDAGRHNPGGGDPGGSGSGHGRGNDSEDDDSILHYLRRCMPEIAITSQSDAYRSLRNAYLWVLRQDWNSIARFDFFVGLAQIDGAAAATLPLLGSSVAAVEQANIRLFGRGDGQRGRGMGISHGISELLHATAEQAKATGRTQISERDLILGLLAPPVDGSIRRGFDYLPFTPEALREAIVTGRAPTRAPHPGPAVTSPSPTDPVEPKRDVAGLEDFRDLRAEARQGRRGGLPPFVGRLRVVHQLLQVLSDPAHGQAVLRGQPGVGKSTLIRHLARLLETQANQAGIADIAAWEVYEVRIAPEAADPGTWLLHHLRTLSESTSAIVVLPGLWELLQLKGVPHAITQALAWPRLRFLATTTNEEFGHALNAEPVLVPQFTPVDLPPAQPGEVPAMVEAYGKYLEIRYRVQIHPEALTRSIQLARQEMPLLLPGAATVRLDRACVRAVAELTRTTSGGLPSGIDVGPSQGPVATFHHDTADDAPLLVVTAQMVEQANR